jgi:hypothetical protein
MNSSPHSESEVIILQQEGGLVVVQELDLEVEFTLARSSVLTSQCKCSSSLLHVINHMHAPGGLIAEAV